jgi:YbgC/YbaW family acyl-CoA thioester hydrolase
MPVPLRRILGLAVRSLDGRRALVSELRDRTRWSSIDLNGHMNYASYLEVMELGRWDWAFRSGALGTFLRSRARPVVVSVDIQYRRELRAGARFTLDTRLVAIERRVALFRQIVLGPAGKHANADIRALLLRQGKVLQAEAVEQLLRPLVVEPRPA